MKRVGAPVAIRREDSVMAKTVLVIDDEWSIREVMALMLEHEGYSSFGAATADEGFAVLEANQVSAVFVDVVLPGKNGLELALELHQKWPRLPIILMSGRVSTEADSIQSFNGRFGITATISKPFTQEQIASALAAALAS